MLCAAAGAVGSGERLGGSGPVARGGGIYTAVLGIAGCARTCACHIGEKRAASGLPASAARPTPQSDACLTTKTGGPPSV